MKPPVETVKVSSKGRDVLVMLKRYTGLTQWNDLLRWAFCASLQNGNTPTRHVKLDTAIDPIDWKTFAGDYDFELAGIFYIRAQKDGIDLSNRESVSEYFRSHLERGIATLRSAKSLDELLSRAKPMALSESD